MSSIFTKIITGEIPSTKLYEDQDIIAIRDIYPQASTHILIIPKKEIPTINDITPQDTPLIGNMFQVAKHLAKELGIEEGYQLKFHVGAKWGQEIMHIHLHLLSQIPEIF